MTAIREFIYRMQQEPGVGSFAVWLLDEHTVETGVVSDHGGQDEVAYCGSCGQDLDGIEACDHLTRLAALWAWHPDYDHENWRPVDE